MSYREEPSLSRRHGKSLHDLVLPPLSSPGIIICTSYHGSHQILQCLEGRASSLLWKFPPPRIPYSCLPFLAPSFISQIRIAVIWKISWARDDEATAACSFHSGVLSPTAALACFVVISPRRPYITCLSYDCMPHVGFRVYQMEDAHKLLMNDDHHFKEIEWLPDQMNFTMK